MGKRPAAYQGLVVGFSAELQREGFEGMGVSTVDERHSFWAGWVM
jgi:hypothetical protein